MALLLCSCGPERKSGGFETPSSTVATVTKSLANKDPSVFWRGMPKSWRSEVQDLVRVAATKIDAQNYDLALGIAQKSIDVLREKRDFILSYPMVAMFGGMMMNGMKVKGGLKAAGAEWNKILAPFSVLVRSEISRHESFATLDVQKFLEGTGRDFMRAIAEISTMSEKDPIAKLAVSEVEVVSQSGDNATVRLTIGDARGKSMNLTKVEDRWVPAKMARDWSDMIKSARKALDKLAVVKNRDATRAKLRTVDAMLDQLLACETAEEFHGIMNKVTRSSRKARPRPGR